MTYARALAEIQQRSIDALKVATDVQLASIEATRDIARTLAAPAPLAAAFGSLTSATTAFTFALLEQQLAYAKEVYTFARNPLPGSAAVIAQPAPAEPFALIVPAEPLAVSEPAPTDVVAVEVSSEPHAAEPEAFDAAARDERPHAIEVLSTTEVLSKTLPPPTGTPAAPRASGFAAKSMVAPSVSNAKPPKRGAGKK